MRSYIGPKDLASLFCIDWGDDTGHSYKPGYALHFAVKPRFWVWGRKHTMLGRTWSSTVLVRCSFSVLAKARPEQAHSRPNTVRDSMLSWAKLFLCH